jgi:ABC-type glycerol-3-phosphate transport system substrate-binding protein
MFAAMVLLFTGLVPNAAFCEGGQESQAAEEAKPITIEYWNTSDIKKEDLEPFVEQYNAEHPNVHVNLTYVPSKGIDERVSVALASGEFPDVFGDAVMRLAMLINRGYLAPLDDAVTGEYEIEDFDSGMFDYGRGEDGNLYAIYYATISWPLLINPELFEQAGVELPDQETRAWTRDHFERAVAAVGSLGDDIYGLGLGAINRGHDKFTDGYIISDGDSWTNSDHTEMVYNSDHNKRVFRWLVDIVRGPHAVPGAAGTHNKTILNLYKEGKVGIIPHGVRFGERIAAEGKPFMYAHYPTDDGSVAKAFPTAYGWCVKDQEDEAKEQAAKDFVLWLTGPERQDFADVWTGMGWSVTRASLRKPAENPEIDVFLNMFTKFAQPEHGIPHYAEIREIWKENYQAAYTGTKEPGEALDDFCAEAQPLLDMGY